MHPLTGKKMVVVGGSRGVGRRIVEEAHDHGAQVLAVARLKARCRNWFKTSPA